MRTDKEKLRKCPVCGAEITKDNDIGLRDYTRWADKHSHGKVGATDIDRVKERRGQFLMWEFKPTKYVPPGQRIFFDAITSQPNWTLYIAIDGPDETCTVGRWVQGQGVVSWWTMTYEQMEELEEMWFEEQDFLYG